MKVAVSGKGGSGKTTIAGIVARVLAEQGRTVLAVDADTNPNLGISVGLGVDATFGLIAARQALDETPPEEREHATTAEELIERFGAEGPDGIRLIQVSKVDHPSPG